MEETFDFEKYRKWCDERHLDASSGESLEAYKGELLKAERKTDKKARQAEQKKIFDLIARHFGSTVEYDAQHYEIIEAILEGIVFAAEMSKVNDEANRIREKYGLDDKNQKKENEA